MSNLDLQYDNTQYLKRTMFITPANLAKLVAVAKRDVRDLTWALNVAIESWERDVVIPEGK